MSGHAAGGADRIAIEARVALAVGDAETMSGHATGGTDVISIIAAQNATAYGDAILMTDQAVGGNDSIEANFGVADSRLVGDAETMTGHATGGDDSLTSTDVRRGAIIDHAELYGDGVHLADHARGGDDVLRGSASFDSVMFGDGAQLLDHASGGNDTLSSAEGSDTMWGDAPVVGPQAATGADLFVISAGGHDQIMDFQPGKDHIELFSFANFQQLSPELQNTGDGVLIALGPNSDLLIRGVTAGQLSVGDFIFG
jgi:hypothetical protein